MNCFLKCLCHLFKLWIKKDLFIYVYAHVCESTYRGQKRAPDSWEPALQVVVNYQTWVLGIKLQSLGAGSINLNHWVFFPEPQIGFFFPWDAGTWTHNLPHAMQVLCHWTMLSDCVICCLWLDFKVNVKMYCRHHLLASYVLKNKSSQPTVGLFIHLLKNVILKAI